MPDFALPLEKFLELAVLVKQVISEKDAKIQELSTQLADAQAKLAEALANDAADAATIQAAQQDAADAKAKLEEIKNDPNSQKLLDAIQSLATDLGVTVPPVEEPPIDIPASA